MEQKLRSALPARTAWIILGICGLFWLLSALGLLQLPASAPAVFMFFWLYLNALTALVSAVAAAAAVAALLLHRRASGPLEERTAPGSAPDDAEETGLDQLLDGATSSLAPAAAAPAAGPGAPKRPQRSGRKRRKR